MSGTIVERIRGITDGRAIKAACKVATTANITLSGEQTIDGVSAVADDRVLVKDQDTASENGIYNVSTGPWSRAYDFDGDNDFSRGTLVYVNSGTIGAATIWTLTTTSPAIGSGLAFAQVVGSSLSSGGGTLTGLLAYTTDDVAAAGTVQADATELAAQWNRIETCVAGAGVKLADSTTMPVGVAIAILNDTDQTAKIWPDSGSALGSLSVDTNDTLGPRLSVTLVRTGAAQWRAFN